MCLWIASLLTGIRPLSDMVHALKGQEPPHLAKARLRAERQAAKAATDRARREGRSTRPGEGKPTFGDVLRVYWGDAMADAIASHNRRREEKRRRVGNPPAGTAQPASSPSLASRVRRFARMIWDGDRRRDAQAPDPAAQVTEALNQPSGEAGPRIACDRCGVTLISLDGGWSHPAGSDCPQAQPPTAAESEPAQPRLPVPCRECGVDTTFLAGDICSRCVMNGVRERGRRHEESDAGESDTDSSEPTRTDEGDDMPETATTPTATGDAHDVESALHECGLLHDDLVRIDTALDVIDEAITSAGSAAELIEAFLASKNVDDSAVGGMATAREMLSAERIKALIDAVAAAKQGVKAAEDELRRLQDLEQQLNGADGSVLNGR